MKARISEEAAPSRILVTRLRYLGDIVLSTPLLEALRRGFPSASIEYLCEEDYAPVLAHHPCVDRVHGLRRGAGLPATLRLVRTLRRPRVDWWIDLFSNPRSAALCWLARPRVAVGGDRGFRARVFHHRMGEPKHGVSAVAHHLHKLEPLLGVVPEAPVSLRVTPEERVAVRNRFGMGAEPPLLLHPGSTWPSKAWPERKWSQLVDVLAADDFAEPWLLTAPGDQSRVERIARAAHAPSRVVPVLPLRELLALISEARAYIGTDGGVLHCAVGLGTPSVGIFGPTEPEIWFPHERYGGARLAQEYVFCRPCHRHHCDHLSCLELLPVSRVRELLRELLGSEIVRSAHA